MAGVGAANVRADSKTRGPVKEMPVPPREELVRIRTIDAHAEGEPLRVIVDGFPQPRGETVLERRRDARDRFDDLRTALMWEPRGHADMYGCLLMPPVTPDADFAVLFLHNEGFSTMCGHGIIAVTAVAVETGIVAGSDDRVAVTIDTPAGVVRAEATLEDGRVREVRFRNVPSFAVALDASVEVTGLGRVPYDLAFGGAFYAYVSADELGWELVPERASGLLEAGRAIKEAVSAQRTPEHTEAEELGFLYGTIFTGRAHASDRHSRHVCVFADGELDRSPTGTGVSGRLAILHARGLLAPHEPIEIESIIGSRFRGTIVDLTRIGDVEAVVPEVGGRAFLTGRHEFWLDPRDPWREGFLLR
ncbi:MAG: proline racemase family protein [Gemmatimonadota bacterium]|nr:proline racemase family protein [Gemmatimonadota bacterium]